MSLNSARRHSQRSELLGENDIPASELRLGRKFAAGAEGQVWTAEYGGLQVAAKQVFSMEICQDLGSLAKEVRVLAQLNHPNIVRFLGLCFKSSSVFIVTELCCCSLSAYFDDGGGRAVRATTSLRFSGKGPLSTSDAAAIARAGAGGDTTGKLVFSPLLLARQISNAMICLHQKSIMHLDLKPENVLLHRVPRGAPTPGRAAQQPKEGRQRVTLVAKVRALSECAATWTAAQSPTPPSHPIAPRPAIADFSAASREASSASTMWR